MEFFDPKIVQEQTDIFLSEMYDVIPISYILSGSRAYGLAKETSDYDYYGIHFMDPTQCFEHPDFRTSRDVKIVRLDKELNEIEDDTEKALVTVTSYEMWKFIDLYLKGAITTYELLFLPTVNNNNRWNKLADLMRKGLTCKIGYNVSSFVGKDLKKQDNKLKTVIMDYYRIYQALEFLTTEEFIWDTDKLFANGTPESQKLLNLYKTKDSKDINWTYEFFAKELTYLVNELDKTTIDSNLPSSCSREILDEVLGLIRSSRASLV
jgi:predicted nucleotidyltransferase